MYCNLQSGPILAALLYISTRVLGCEADCQAKINIESGRRLAIGAFRLERSVTLRKYPDKIETCKKRMF